MDNPDALSSILTHVGTAGGGGGLVAMAARWFATKEAHETNVRLAVIDERLSTMARIFEKYSDLGEKFAILKNTVTALHERMDRYDKADDRRD